MVRCSATAQYAGSGCYAIACPASSYADINNHANNNTIQHEVFLIIASYTVRQIYLTGGLDIARHTHIDAVDTLSWLIVLTTWSNQHVY